MSPISCDIPRDDLARRVGSAAGPGCGCVAGERTGSLGAVVGGSPTGPTGRVPSAGVARAAPSASSTGAASSESDASRFRRRPRG
jgi:hypothetical protein